LQQRLRACTQLVGEDQGPGEFSVDPDCDGSTKISAA